MTNVEVLEAWDAGEPINSVEMGGFGEDYEYVIQFMAFEFLRCMLENYSYGSIENDIMFSEYLDSIANDTLKNYAREEGVSGHQWNAAGYIAGMFIKLGYEWALEKAPEDRIITITRRK